MTPLPAIRQRGFTLIEILVALLILGIMTALGYGAYRAARVSATGTEESLKRTREIEFGMRVLMQDISEAAPRPVRDVLGESRLPAVRGTQGAGVVSPSTSPTLGATTTASSGLSFSSGSGFNSGSQSQSSAFGGSSNTPVNSVLDITRMGWSNTAGQQRGTLQRVSYALVDDVLKRAYQVNLDTVLGNKPVVQDLLTGVKGIQLRYLDMNQAWQTQWPVSNSVTDQFSRPAAIEVVIEFKDWGRVRRLIEVAG
ncbi:MAG TPA: type II secretion system minor pseudopilin GspJ [Steroidobacteraceae bacterium]|jgi:general secretion pathway protein J